MLETLGAIFLIILACIIAFCGYALYLYKERAAQVRPLAEEGVAEAQFRLGMLYEGGIGGVKKDRLESKKWYEKAANQGHTEALYRLGGMYEFGLGIAKNIHKAMELYEVSAHQGFARAQFHLGVLYATGDEQGVSKDLLKACVWLTIAKANGQNMGELNNFLKMATSHQVEIIEKSVLEMLEINPNLIKKLTI